MINIVIFLLAFFILYNIIESKIIANRCVKISTSDKYPVGYKEYFRRLIVKNITIVKDGTNSVNVIDDK